MFSHASAESRDNKITTLYHLRLNTTDSRYSVTVVRRYIWLKIIIHHVGLEEDPRRPSARPFAGTTITALRHVRAFTHTR